MSNGCVYVGATHFNNMMAYTLKLMVPMTIRTDRSRFDFWWVAIGFFLTIHILRNVCSFKLQCMNILYIRRNKYFKSHKLPTGYKIIIYNNSSYTNL